MAHIVRFNFPQPGDRRAIEDDIGLAVFATECLYGRPRTRLQLRYQVAPDGTCCVAEVRGHAGEAAIQIFTGLAGVRCGESAFSVERLPIQRDEGATAAVGTNQ